MKKVYLASGWFNLAQKEMMDEIYHVLETLEGLQEITLFAPFYDGIVLDPKNDPDWKSKMAGVWNLDINELSSSDLVVASTQDHDVGTIFECGYASAKRIPILCYNSNPELGLNLMLSQEARGFIKSPEQLTMALESFLDCSDVQNWKFNEFGGLPI